MLALTFAFAVCTIMLNSGCRRMERFTTSKPAGFDFRALWCGGQTSEHSERNKAHAHNKESQHNELGHRIQRILANNGRRFCCCGARWWHIAPPTSPLWLE